MMSFDMWFVMLGPPASLTQIESKYNFWVGYPSKQFRITPVGFPGMAVQTDTPQRKCDCQQYTITNRPVASTNLATNICSPTALGGEWKYSRGRGRSKRSPHPQGSSSSDSDKIILCIMPPHQLWIVSCLFFGAGKLIQTTSNQKNKSANNLGLIQSRYSFLAGYPIQKLYLLWIHLSCRAWGRAVHVGCRLVHAEAAN